MNATGEKYLTLAEVRARLQISRATLYRLTRERGLRVVRCGGVCRIAESELSRWTEKHTEDSNGEATP